MVEERQVEVVSEIWWAARIYVCRGGKGRWPEKEGMSDEGDVGNGEEI